jgi:hypothetical protein
MFDHIEASGIGFGGAFTIRAPGSIIPGGIGSDACSDMSGEHPLRQRQIILSTRNGISLIALLVSVVALSGCVTTKPKTKEAGEIKPEISASEQLASALNAKAAATAQKPGGYRDPQVRSVTGAQRDVAQSQSSTGFYPSAPTPPAGPVAGSAGIAGLVTQPTALNANRSSIYSAAPPIAVRPDGTLAGPVEAYAAPQPFRNVYSSPALAPAPIPQQVGIMPLSEQTSLNAAPPQPQPQQAAAMAASARGRPTADATPSRILPPPGKSHMLDSQEALMVARSLAAKQSQGGNMTMPQGSALATLPQPSSDITMTPGMAASLK